MSDTDKQQERMEDVILLNEIVDNERIITHPTYGEVRLRRPTPRMEKKIAEERRKQYHADIKNPEILSKAQLQKYAEERGIWDSERDEHYQYLVTRMGELMGLLESIGYQDVDTAISDYYKVVNELQNMFEDESEAWMAVDRFTDLDGDPTAEDRKMILEHAPSTEVDDLVQEIHTYRTQIIILKELSKVRKELSDLQMIRAQLFLESMESRAERAEEYARLFFCTENAETSDPLWPAFDDIWDSDPEDLGQLISEMYYFLNGISDSYRAILGKHGLARRKLIEEVASEDSQETPKTNSDGESPESEQPNSSELETASP